jgi:ribonuclease HI
VLYTEGSYFDHGEYRGIGGWAYRLECDEKVECGHGAESLTRGSITFELLAVLNGLRRVQPEEPVEVRTDCEAVVHLFHGAPPGPTKKRTNVDIIKEIHDMRRRLIVTCIKISRLSPEIQTLEKQAKRAIAEYIDQYRTP